MCCRIKQINTFYPIPILAGIALLKILPTSFNNHFMGQMPLPPPPEVSI